MIIVQPITATDRIISIAPDIFSTSPTRTTGIVATISDAASRAPGVSILPRASLPHLTGKYDVVNIKLDKTGGLTEALAMVRAAKASGMSVMVGCMVAGSISMAPAVLLAGLCDAADLDGPLWLAEDVEGGLVYRDGWVEPPLPGLWG